MYRLKVGKGITMKRVARYVFALSSSLLLLVPVAATANATGQRVAPRPAGDIRQREQWFYGQRAYPFHAIPSGALFRAERQGAALASSSRAAVAAATVGTWSSIGPSAIPAGAPSQYNGAAPWAGRVTAIAHDPSNAAVAYLGAADGGVWKTTDSGSHWTPVFDSQPSLAIGSIAVDPGNSSTVYVGTGELNDPSGYSDSDQYFGAGIFKSTNGGATWSKVAGATFNNCYVSNVLVQPGSSATVFAGVGNQGRYVTGCANGIYRSLNGGSTWTREETGPISDLVAKPGTPTTWFAAFYKAGVWKSVDDGVTWSQLTGGLPTTNIGRIALAVTGANPARVYAVMGDSSQNAKYVYTSTDSGATWSALAQYSNFCGYTNSTATPGQCDYDLSAAGYAPNQNYLYVGGIRLERWDGSKWTVLGYDGTRTDGIHVDFHSVTFDAQSRLWAGSDGGAYRRINGGDVVSGFANLNATLGITQFYPGISGTTTGTLLGGTQDNGSLQRTSLGWYELEVGDGGYTALDSPNAYRFTTYVNATVFRDPGGNCLFSADSGQPNLWNSCSKRVSDPSLFISPLVQSPSSSATLYVGTNRIWKSTNDGSTWGAISPQYSGYVSAIAQAKSNPSVLYAAWSNIAQNRAGSAFVAVSTNGGSNWSGTQTLPNRFITDLAVKTSASNTAWVTLSGYNTGHVYVTQNSGTSWTDKSGNLPNVPVNGIAVDSRTSPSTLYVATDVGVFESTNGGSTSPTWVNISGALPHTVVTDIRLDQASNVLIAATHGRGMWTAPIS